jgi:predicted esterase
MIDGQNYAERRLKVARTARWGVIGTLGPATAEVWIALHGYGGLASEFAASARWPDHPATAFVFPEALQRFYVAEPNTPHANAPVGASWMTKDARLDDIADNHAYLHDLVGAVRGEAPKAAIGALGFSQGAATAARWAVTRAERGDPLNALLLWGALLPPEVDVGPDAVMRATPLKFVCGTRDRWITPKLVRGEKARLDAASFPYVFQQFEGGHRLDDDALRAALTSL